jgi:hypothetical protein
MVNPYQMGRTNQGRLRVVTDRAQLSVDGTYVWKLIRSLDLRGTCGTPVYRQHGSVITQTREKP